MSAVVVISESAEANAASVVYNKPASAAIGDYLVVMVLIQANKSLSGVPTDMTAVAGITNPIQTGTASSDIRAYFYTHPIAADSPASWTFTQSASARISVLSTLVRGQDPTTPVDAVSSATLTLTAPSVTTTTDALLLYLTGYWSTGGTGSFTPPSGMTEAVETSGAQSSALGEVAYEARPTAGATGTRAATFTGTAGKHVAAHIAIRSAASGLAAPTGLTATAVSSSQINLAWNTVSGATAYDVERDSAIVAVGVATNAYSDTGRSPGTAYSYRVRSTS